MPVGADLVHAGQLKPASLMIGANAIPSEHLVGNIRTAIEWAALSIEILGAVVIFAGVLRVAITRGAVRFLLKLDEPGAYDSYKHQVGRSLLLGLEFPTASIARIG
jgi:uncharacterized membrane protein